MEVVIWRRSHRCWRHHLRERRGRGEGEGGCQQRSKLSCPLASSSPQCSHWLEPAMSQLSRLPPGKRIACRGYPCHQNTAGEKQGSASVCAQPPCQPSHVGWKQKAEIHTLSFICSFSAPSAGKLHQEHHGKRTDTQGGCISGPQAPRGYLLCSPPV